ncbi:uncharacterized protein DDB_G0287625-like [Lineus longissimus]|uniref:uncharacterized protein DDB_G0287625-like n=1 Tax=Lineus longissimus TaxID=88925 RepID=UPI002B4C7429
MATNLGMASLADKLRLAASKGQFDKVEELLRAGANTYDTDNEGRSSLHLACYHGFPDVTQILLDAGSDVNTQDHMGYTPLHRAASQGHREIINLLLARECLLDIQDRVHGNAPIHEAAWNGFSESLDMLIKAKARIFLTNKSGFTALHLASQNGHNQSARVLLYGNANADMKNNYGDTPLHTAARYGHAGVTRILMSARARINEQNKNGDTALHIAAALKRRKITKLVVEAGIDPNIRNKQGETAVDVARRKDHAEVIQLILKPKARRRGKKDDLDGTRTISVTMSDPDLMEDKGPEEKETKKAKFPFFRKKNKKSKAKVKSSPGPTPPQRVPPQGGPGQTPSPHQASPAAQAQQGQPGRPGQRGRPTVGFFNQYVPRPGVQYYRDLAGNVKQGPVGFAPVCQCTPALKQFEQRIENDNRNVYNHVEVARKMLTERIDMLDHRGQQQMFQVGDMFEEDEEACRERIHQRSLEDRQYQEQFVEDYSDGLKNELKTWTADRMKSLERRVVKGHHHDDADWTHGRPHKSGGMVQSLNYNNIVEGRLYRARSDETLSVSEYNQKQKTEREMAHQVALRELRSMQRSRAARDDRRRDRKPPQRKEPAMVKVQFEHDNMRRVQSAGREPVIGREQVSDTIHRSQSAGREIPSGRDMMQSTGREPMHQMAQERERVPGRDYVQVKPHPDQFRRGSVPDQFGRRGSNSDQFGRGEANPSRERVQVREHSLSRDQYLRNNTPQREYPERRGSVPVLDHLYPRDMPPKNEKHFNQERIFDGQEQKFSPLRTSPDGHNFRPTSFSEGTSGDLRMINRTEFYSPRKVHSQDELSPKKNQGQEARPDLSAKSSPNVSNPPNVPLKTLDPNLLQRFEKMDTNGNVHVVHPRQGLPYDRDNYYDNRSPGHIQEKTVARAPPVANEGHKSDPNLLDVTKQNTSFNKNSSFRDNSYNNNDGYKNNGHIQIGSHNGANSSRSANSSYSDSFNNSGNYYHVQHSTANYDNHNHSGSEPSYAYIVPKQHQKTDSGSNPDSGYSSKIYGGKVQPTPRQNGSGSPNTPGSTCSTGHNISSITSTSISTDQSFPSAHSSPVSCASDNESNQRQYYERVSQEMNRYYQRRGVPQHPPARNDGRLQFVNPGQRPNVERKLEPVTATDV